MANSHQKELRERLCRDISRPAVSEKRLALTSHGKVRYELKTPHRESLPREHSECIGYGTTHVFFDRGGLPPNSKHRTLVTPGKRGKGRKPTEVECTQEKTIEERRNTMTWMQRLKRVFNIDIEQCERCVGHVKVVECVEDPAVIPNTLAALAGQALEKILQHLALKESPSISLVNDARGPPDQSALFKH